MPTLSAIISWRFYTQDQYRLMNNRSTIVNRLRIITEDRISLLWLLLISGDVAFILLYIFNRMYRFMDMEIIRLDIDGSHPEFYQYTKFVWILILLIYTALTTKNKSYLSWILVFLYFLTDDVLRLHERSGRFLNERVTFEPPFELRVQDVGEFAAFAIFGLPLLALLGWTYFRGSLTFKKISRDLMLLVVVFAFFVVIFDILHAAVDLSPSMNRIWTLIEDGGEMIVVSTMVWYLFRVAFYKGEPKTFLLDSPTEDTPIAPA